MQSTMKQPSVRSLASIGWMICALGAIYYCYEYFLRITPSVITPELMRTYHLTGAEVGNLSAFYYHAYTPMQFFVGMLMDRYGPRRLLTLACLLCAVGTYFFASGYGLAIAQAGRFLVGFGSAFAFVGALKLATIWLPPNRFALVSGIITCLGMLGAMGGDILLRALVDVAGWQLSNYAAAAIGVILSGILWVMVRDVNPVHVNHQNDTLDFKTLFRGLRGILKNPQIWFTGLVGCLLYLSLSAFGELWAIPYLEQAKGLTRGHAAVASSMIFFGWAVGGPLWGWLSDYIEQRRLPLMISSMFSMVFVCLLLYVPGWSLPAIYLLMFGFGVMSSVQILIFAICREVSSMRIAGTAIALTNMIVMIGGSIFQPFVGSLLDKNWTGTLVDGARIYSPLAYEIALSVLPVGILLSIVLTFFIKETHGRVKSD